jgi:predicted dehydrogenase
MSKLVAAVIGTGFIGPVHVEGLLRAGVHVAGIMGSTPEKSIAAADRWNLPRGYASLAELLADETVDVVHITSPNRHHFEQASAVIAAGKHVLCEKPLAMNSPQSAALLRLAQQAGVVAGVNYNIRYYPLCMEAANRVATGSFGDLFHVSGSYSQDWLLHRSDFNWRLLADEGGELRAVADIGTHLLDLIGFITGRRVEAVFADLQTVYQHRDRPIGEVETFSGKMLSPVSTHPVAIDTEDHGSILLRFQGGAKGCISVSQVTAGRKNCLRLELAGSLGSFSWDSQSPNLLWLGHRDKPNETLIRDPSLMSERAREFATYPGGHNEGFPDTFKQLFRDFYRYIEAGDFRKTPSFPTFADGHQEILLCEAILRSHREQRWVKIA